MPENDFFEFCLDEISYNTPYLQVFTEKKKYLKIFFLIEIFSAAAIHGSVLKAMALVCTSTRSWNDQPHGYNRSG